MKEISGRWIQRSIGYNTFQIECSLCEGSVDRYIYPYCPWCGKPMMKDKLWSYKLERDLTEEKEP